VKPKAILVSAEAMVYVPADARGLIAEGGCDAERGRSVNAPFRERRGDFCSGFRQISF